MSQEVLYIKNVCEMELSSGSYTVPDYRLLYEQYKKKSDELEQERKKDLEKMKLLQQLSAGHKMAAKKAENLKAEAEVTIARLRKELQNVRAEVIDLQNQLYLAQCKHSQDEHLQPHQVSFEMSVHEPDGRTESQEGGKDSKATTGIGDRKSSPRLPKKSEDGPIRHKLSINRKRSFQEESEVLEKKHRKPGAEERKYQFKPSITGIEEDQNEEGYILENECAAEEESNDKNEGLAENAVDLVYTALERIVKAEAGSQVTECDIDGVFEELATPGLDITVDDLVEGFTKSIFSCSYAEPRIAQSDLSDCCPASWFESTAPTGKEHQNGGNGPENNAFAEFASKESCFIGVWCKSECLKHHTIPWLIRCIICGDSQVPNHATWLSQPIAMNLSRMVLMGLMVMTLELNFDTAKGENHGKTPPTKASLYLEKWMAKETRRKKVERVNIDKYRVQLTHICAAACVTAALYRLTGSYEEFQVFLLDILLIPYSYYPSIGFLSASNIFLPALVAAVETWPAGVPTTTVFGESLQTLLRHACSHHQAADRISQVQNQFFHPLVLLAAANTLDEIGKTAWNWPVKRVASSHAISSAWDTLKSFSQKIHQVRESP